MKHVLKTTWCLLSAALWLASFQAEAGAAPPGAVSGPDGVYQLVDLPEKELEALEEQCLCFTCKLPPSNKLEFRLVVSDGRKGELFDRKDSAVPLVNTALKLGGKQDKQAVLALKFKRPGIGEIQVFSNGQLERTIKVKVKGPVDLIVKWKKTLTKEEMIKSLAPLRVLRFFNVAPKLNIYRVIIESESAPLELCKQVEGKQAVETAAPNSKLKVD